MLGRKSFPKKTKRGQKMHDKTYNWCTWHNTWVQHYPEGKRANGCRLHNKLEEKQKTDIQGQAQELKSTLLELNE